MKQTMSPLVTSRERHRTSPLPGTAGMRGRIVVPVHDPRARRGGHLGRAVGGSRVDDDDLVDQRDLLHEVVTDHGDDVTDRLLLVERGQDDADRTGPCARFAAMIRWSGRSVTDQERVAQPALDFFQHSARLLCVLAAGAVIGVIHLAVRTTISTVLAFGYSLEQRG